MVDTSKAGVTIGMTINSETEEAEMKNKPRRLIIGLEQLNLTNAEGCPACGQKFNLGDPVVAACGAWEGGPKLIHENEAVFDNASGEYIERRCFKARTAGRTI
jgi:hypothetical protein